MQKKNILHLINGEFFSGAERVQDLLACNLPALGYEIYFACLKPKLFIENCQSRKDRIFNFPMNSRFDFFQSLKIARFARKYNCRLIHTHTPRAALIGSLTSIITGLPLVHHVHSPTLLCTENYWRNRINSLMEQIAFHKTQKIIAVSKSLGKYLTSMGLKDSDFFIIPNGVPIPGPLPCRLMPAGEFVIGVIALFRPRKGLEVLLEALAELKKQGYGFLLSAVGEFESEKYEKKIKTLAVKLELTANIEWIGFRHNINEELQKMDLFVLPSLAGEGTPMVILEAMSMGVPIVASKVEGVPEVIRDNQEGMLVTPGDVKELAYKITKIMNNASCWESLRENGYQRQSKFYSAVRMATDVAFVYNGIIGK